MVLSSSALLLFTLRRPLSARRMVFIPMIRFLLFLWGFLGPTSAALETNAFRLHCRVGILGGRDFLVGMVGEELCSNRKWELSWLQASESGSVIADMMLQSESMLSRGFSSLSLGSKTIAWTGYSSSSSESLLMRLLLELLAHRRALFVMAASLTKYFSSVIGGAVSVSADSMIIFAS